ncbi:hypothetical protein FRC12_016543 [Ceratobasidium sp. 428]|nr:hypothetical protein FRC12_016543 [Ceratobasidium sp. 428]
MNFICYKPFSSNFVHGCSKDHFGLILNEPAGNLAKIIVTHTVQMITKAWDDTSVHARQVIEPILECMFHPDFHKNNSAVQREMLQYMDKWVSCAYTDLKNDVARRLSKDSVRNHQATRLKEQGQSAHASGAGYNAALQAQSDIGNYFNSVGANQIGGIFTGGHGGRRELSGDNVPPGGAPGHGHGHSGAVPSGGEAGQFYGTGQSQSGYNPQYSAPPGPPPQGGAGIGFPSPSSAPLHTPPGGAPYSGGYSPNYGGSQPSTTPTFPSAPGFPAPGGGFAPPSFPPPGGGFPQPAGGFPEPGFGGGYGAPPSFPGGPPSFPGGPPGGPQHPPDNSTYPGQHHGHHQHQGYNPSYGGGSGW